MDGDRRTRDERITDKSSGNFCTLCYCAQKRETAFQFLNTGVWRLLNEQNRKAAEIVCKSSKLS
jgi:hypothetical protein